MSTDTQTDQTQPETKAQAKATALVVHDEGPLAYMMDSARFSQLHQVAKAFSASLLVPEHFQGKLADCTILCMLAVRLNVDPFMLAQHLYVVHGKPGLDAQVSIALLNASGKIKGAVRYEFSGEGDDYGCTAYVHDVVANEIIRGPKVDWKTVKGEGWDQDKKTRTGQVLKSKWRTMPEQMFRYRAASYLTRAHYPEVTMGLRTREELEDAVIDVESRLSEPPDGPRPATRAEAITQALREQQAGASETAEQEPTTSGQPAAQQPAPDREPGADDESEGLAFLRAALAKATTVTEVNAAAEEAKKSIFPDDHEIADGLAEVRRNEIRSKRGPRAKGKLPGMEDADEQPSAVEQGA